MKHQLADPNFPYLRSMAELLCNSLGIHVCIHDLTGILRPEPILAVPLKYKYHNNEFCSAVKSYPLGWRYCALCKTISLKRIAREKKEYYGNCFMGINEIVKPVLIDGKPVAVIYLGNFYLKEDREEIILKIKRACEVTGMPETALLEELKTVKAASSSDIKEFYNAVEILNYSIILAYQSMFAKNSVDLNLGGTGRRHWLVQSVKDYVNVHYYSSIKLDYIAKTNFFNANYLASIFKQETGMTFITYLNSVRLEKAKELLCGTEMKIIDISVQVGFENVTYFNRVFKKMTGSTPLEYREANRPS